MFVFHLINICTFFADRPNFISFLTASHHLFIRRQLGGKWVPAKVWWHYASGE